MKRILFIIGLLFCSTNAWASAGVLDGSFADFGAQITDVSGSTAVNFAKGSAVQPDGKIVVVGSSGTTSLAAIVRYNTNGSIDTTFGIAGIVTTDFGQGSAIANAVTVLPSGKILVVGSLTVTAAVNYFVAQFLPNGNLDPDFGGGSGCVFRQITGSSADVANAVVVDGVGTIYVIGTSVQSDLGCVFVAQYTPTGELNSGVYNSGAAVGGGGSGTTIPGIALLSRSSQNYSGNAGVLDGDGKMIVTGPAGTSPVTTFVAKILPNGTLDTAFCTFFGGIASFAFGADSPLYSIGLQSTGQIIVTGNSGLELMILSVSPANSEFGSLTHYIFYTPPSATSAVGYSLKILNYPADQVDQIVVGGTADFGSPDVNDFFIACFASDLSGVVTTFNPSNGYNNTDIAHALSGGVYTGSVDVGSSMSLQQDGRFILTGSSLSEIISDVYSQRFATARYLGFGTPQGCMDTTYQDSTTPGFKIYPTTSDASAQPKVVAMYPLSDNSLYVLTSGAIGQLGILAADGTAGVPATIGDAPINNDVIADADEDAVVVGSDGVNGWIARYKVVMNTVISDETFAGGLVTSPQTSTLRRVGQQTNGRYVAIGQSSTSSDGILIAYTENGALADHTAPMPFGYDFGSGVSGFITTEAAVFTDLLVGPDDSIYVAYQNNATEGVGAGYLCIVKFLPDGSGLDPEFHSDGIANTGLFVDSCALPSIAFDSTFEHILLAVVELGTNVVFVQNWEVTGGIERDGGIIDPSVSLLSNPVITKLQCDTNNNLVLNGYDANNFFVARCSAEVVTTVDLDTTFAPYGACPGILKTNYNDNNPTNPAGLTVPYRFSNSVCINNLGNILFGGYENITNSSTVSVVGQVVGNIGGPIYTQVLRFPRVIPNGTIDTSFGTDGALDLSAGPIELPQGQARVINVIHTGPHAGKILVSDSDGDNCIIAALNATGTSLDTDAFGFFDGKLPSFGLFSEVQAILVDSTGLGFYTLGTTGRFLFTNYQTGSGGSFNNSSLTQNYAIAQQASGRILVAGYNSAVNSGVIVAYDPQSRAIDTSFNPGGLGGAAPNVAGYWYTGISNPITSLSIGSGDYADKIYFAYDDVDGHAAVSLLLENGTALDSDFNFTAPIHNVSDAEQIRMQLDASGNIVLAANISGAGIQAARYNADGTNSGGSAVAAATILEDTAGQILENILTLSDGTTLVLGAVPNAIASLAFMNMACLNTSFDLDASFNTAGDTPGILSTNIPSSSFTPVMADFYAMDVMAGGNILVAGDNNPTAVDAHPYFGAIIKTGITTKVPQSATTLGAPGMVDTTCNPAGANPGYINLSNEIPDSFAAETSGQVLLQLSNGVYLVASSNGESSSVIKMSADDVQDESFGVVDLEGNPDIKAMLLLQSGDICAVGGAGGVGSQAGWMTIFSQSGEIVVTATTGLDAHYSVGQQASGRIIVAGKKQQGDSAVAIGAMVAYNSITGVIDESFGNNGYFFVPNQDFTTETLINSIIISATDDGIIYYIYQPANPEILYGNVYKALSNGTAANIWAFPQFIFGAAVQSSTYLAFALDGSVILAMSFGDRIYMQALNGTTGQYYWQISFSSDAEDIRFRLPVDQPVLTSMVVDAQGHYILTGYDALTPNQPFVMRVLNSIQDGLDQSFNPDGAIPGVQSAFSLSGATIQKWNSAIISATGKITLTGVADVTSVNEPFLGRLYGNEFIAQYLPVVAAKAGKMNSSMAVSLVDDGQAVSAIPQVILPSLTNGSQYIAFNDGTISRYTNANVLDTSYNGTGHAIASPSGLYAMSYLGNGGLLVAGTISEEVTNGWVEQYTTAGTPDTNFGIDGIVNLAAGTVATVALQQSLSRIVVAGKLGSGNGGVFALTNTGFADTTFAVGSSAGIGVYDTGVSTTIYAMIADEFDRLIIAYKNGSAIDIRRLTSSGQLDTTFGSGGTIAGALTGTATATAEVRVALNQSGDIVVAAHTSAGISVIAYANGTGTVVAYAQCNIATVITNSPVLTSLIGYSERDSVHDKVLLAGYQSGTNNMWVARVTANNIGTAYILDTTFGDTNFFDPRTFTGIMTFTNIDTPPTVSARNLTSIAIYSDGEISIVGTETTSASPNNQPFMSRAYNASYVNQTPIDLQAKAAGTNDRTFGASSTAANDLGITFYATTDGINQIAKAAVIQNDNVNNIIVAVDGTATEATNSCMYLNIFDVDGLLNTSFVQPAAPSDVEPGQALILSMFDDQYVNDMLSFTAGGVNKAILVGYAQNTTPSLVGSLLVQVDLTPDIFGLDTTFGGLNGNSAGVAFGDARQLNTVGLQSTGRIIAAGLDQSSQGLLLGYTAAGNLDQSFGQGGTRAQGLTGIYASAIDNQDRLVVAYVVGSGPRVVTLARILPDGSDVDTTFDGGIVTTEILTAISDSNLRMAIDGEGNIVVASVVTDTAAGTCFKIARYSSEGVLIGSTNLIGAASTPSYMGLTALTITKMLIDSNGAVIIVGYDNAASDMIVVARLVFSDGYELDSTFNTDDTPGFIKYAVHGTSEQQTVGAFIHPDGRIIITGAQQA